MRLKSFTSPKMFCPISAVPAFPGSIKIWLHFLLLEKDRATACSLPPPPITKTFILLL